MKVVLISPFSLAASSSRRLFRPLKDLDVDKTFLMVRQDKYGTTPRGKDIKYTMERRNDRLYPLYLVKTLLMMVKEKPDIVHFMKPHHLTLVPALIYARLFGKKLVFDCDDNEPEVQKELGRSRIEVFLAGLLMKIGLRFSDAVLITTDRMLSWIPEKFHKKVHHIPTGTDTDEFKPASRTGDGFFRVTFVGNLYKIAEPLLLVDAVGIMVKDIPEIRCRIIGGGSEEKRFRETVEKKGLSGFFEIKGALPHESIPQELSESDALILPYPDTPGTQELGTKLFEYMAMQRPLIATSVGSIPKVLEDGKAGLLVPPGSPLAMADAIRWVHDHPQEAGVKAAYARKLAVEKYDRRVLSKKLEGVYKTLAGAA